uniref:hypothetical protein n=1 Tax=Staphylococcus capitis TaxID=29388 RepID=UPI002892E74A|nr:hypothetical protein [Staphylococcus capitis]
MKPNAFFNPPIPTAAPSLPISPRLPGEKAKPIPSPPTIAVSPVSSLCPSYLLPRLTLPVKRKLRFESNRVFKLMAPFTLFTSGVNVTIPVFLSKVAEPETFI